MSDLQPFVIMTAGGINQSAPQPSPEFLEEATNFVPYRGRLALRAPIEQIEELSLSISGSSLIAVTEHEAGIWALEWNGTTDEVALWSTDVNGANPTEEATVWTGVTTKPHASLVSFTGGDADTNQARLYISDYDQNFITRYWDGSSLNDLTVDFNADDTAEDVHFSLMISYKFHLWGTGFFEGTALRPEMLRFSQPGLIPGTDLAGGDNPKEWWAADHRSVGRRGSKIRALSIAGDSLLVFQERATHAIFGSGADTWTRQTISTTIGCVGPKAVASVDKRVAYFWASDGPYRTDGSSLQYIGHPIRQLVTEVDATQADTVVGYSPDDGVVHFFVSEAGADEYSLDLAFNHRTETWSTANWSVGTNIEAGSVTSSGSGSLDGPEAAPSSLTATAVSTSRIDLAWTNGDVNIDTKTHVYRSTSSGFTPSDGGNLIATVTSGATEYEDDDISDSTTFFYKLRHFRNSQHSSESNQASASTGLPAPTDFAATGITGGLRLSGDNNASEADIEIERSTSPGSGFSNITTLSDPGATFSYDNTGLDCGDTYYYRAKASKAGFTDSAYTDVISAVACAGGGGGSETAPAAPSGLTVVQSDLDPTILDLSWTDNSDNEDEFQIFRTEPGDLGDFFYLASTEPNQTSYSDGDETEDLEENTEYSYKVRACNVHGCSAFSNSDSATTGEEPPS